MATKLTGSVSLALLAAFVLARAEPALALTTQEIGGLNSGTLDVLQSCTLDPSHVPQGIQRLAARYSANPKEAGSVASTILLAAQMQTDSPSCLFAVGEGMTGWALSFGDQNPTAVSIATTIGQVGKTPVINACVNVAGVKTPVGLACDPPTGDVFRGASREHVTSFGQTGENPNRDEPSPN
jgi:hypothetical protein